MKAKCIKRFFDLKANVQREPEEEFTCEPERFRELEKLGFVRALSHKGRPTKDELIEEVKETKTNPEIAGFLGKEMPEKIADNKKPTEKEG